MSGEPEMLGTVMLIEGNTYQAGNVRAQVPISAGRVVSMVTHNGKVLVACEFGVYVLDGDVLRAIEWAWE